MKKAFLFIVVAFSGLAVLSAQSPCNNGRYASDVFVDVVISADIQYGSNINYIGKKDTLTMDIYQPKGDTITKRPLIIWAHGGSFINGTKKDSDMVVLSKIFAKKGFVCASVKYRLGLSALDSTNAIITVVRAVQDMKAAIRFFYKDKKMSNSYKIDTTNIFIGGSSAGAIMALHTAYLDKSCEANYYLSDSQLTGLGGLEGYSGNQCYSHKIKGVINICGALGRYGWIQSGDVPFCSLHGTEDKTVSYNRGLVNPGVPLMYLDGSRMLKEQAKKVGVSNPFYSWYGQGHVPYQGGPNALAYMDTTIRFIRDFLIANLDCNNPPLLPENKPLQTAYLYPYTPCTVNILLACDNTGISDLASTNDFEVYPNPAVNEMTIVFPDKATTNQIELMDITGKVIFQGETVNRSYILQTTPIPSGIYFLRVTEKSGKVFSKKVIFR